jgi:hypothetical protein
MGPDEDVLRMIEAVGRWLGWLPEFWPRLAPLAEIQPSGDFALPPGDELRELLGRLDVPPQAIVEIVAARPTPDQSEAWWLLERLHHALVSADEGWFDPPWPAPWPTDDDPFTRHFHTYVFLAAVPHVLAVHARRGVPSRVTWAALTDIGLQIANYEVRFGRPGFDGAVWMWPHFRGDVFRLGRLQYDVTHIAFDDEGVTRGEQALAVHIPALGPLDPGACDASFDAARTFFPTHFPERTHRVVTCRSWLMDPQLGGYLPETSNIIRFQRRFRIAASDPKAANDDVLRYVFGFLPTSLDELPRTSSVQRAVVKHLEAGGTWQMRHGWFELSSSIRDVQRRPG